MTIKKICRACLGTPWANIDPLQCLQISLSCGAKARAVEETIFQHFAKNAGAIQKVIGDWAIGFEASWVAAVFRMKSAARISP